MSAASIPADGYGLGVGRLVVDLRGLDWNQERVVRLKVRLGTGQADVFVPERVCVTGTTHVGIGESEVAGRAQRRGRRRLLSGRGRERGPRLELDGKVDIGQLRVINSDTRERRRQRVRAGPFDEDTAPLRAAEARRARRDEGGRVSLASGVVVAAIGALILLDYSGAVDVTLGWIAVVLTGASGRSC